MMVCIINVVKIAAAVKMVVAVLKGGDGGEDGGCGCEDGGGGEDSSGGGKDDGKL